MGTDPRNAWHEEYLRRLESEVSGGTWDRETSPRSGQVTGQTTALVCKLIPNIEL